MNRYAAWDGRFEVIGSLHLEPLEGGGIRPHRLPGHLLPQVPAAFMRVMVDAAAGVRIRFMTRANRLGFILTTHPIELAGSSPAFPAFADLVVDGTLVDTRRLDGPRARLDVERDVLDIAAGPPTTVSFDDLGSADKVVELWLPHTAVVDVHAVEADAPVRPAPLERRPRWLHHGSSISHCLETATPTTTWPAIAAQRLGLDLLDLAFAGNAMLDPFVARAIRDARADVISLKLGIDLVVTRSTSMRTFVPAVNGFLDTIRDGHPMTPILVISPIACPAVEERGATRSPGETGSFKAWAAGPVPPGASTLRRIRTALQVIVAQRARTDSCLAYLDGRELFSAADAAAGMLPDGLHPNRVGYRLMGERFALFSRVHHRDWPIPAAGPTTASAPGVRSPVYSHEA